MQYIVKDSFGNIMRVFSSYKDAITYKFTFGNSQWIIIY